MNKILAKIFRAQTRGFQVWLAYGGFSLGLLILLAALQLYGQLGAVFGEKKLGGYVLITKQVGISNTLFWSRPSFSEGEIADLKAQPFIENLAPLYPNQFEVTAFAEQAGFYSELFFEAIDKRFLDEQPPAFEWEEGQEEIPIILARDMLDLYNFGFALGKGGNLPQISPATAKLIPIGIRIKGEKGEMRLSGRVVGFSERVSSVLVPVSFMKWANKRLGAGKPTKPSRLLLKVQNTASPALTAYLSDKGYQLNEDRLRAGKIGGIVQNMMSAVGIIGALFMLLSGVLFVMNFRAILAEARQEIELLLQLGYTPQMLTYFLMRGFTLLLGIVFAIVAVCVWVGESMLTPLLIARGLEVPQGVLAWVWAVGAGFVLIAIAANYLSVRQNIERNIK